MVKPGNISISQARRVSGLDERTIGLLSVSGMWPPILHYRDGSQINGMRLRKVMSTPRWRAISRTRYLSSEEARALHLTTDETTLAFCVGRRQYHDRDQVLAATATASMLNGRRTSADRRACA